MTLAFRAASTANTGTTTPTTLSGTVPAGTLQGDTIVAALYVESTVTSGPSGYVSVPGSPVIRASGAATPPHLYVYTRIVGTSEPNPAWVWNSISGATLVIASFSGGDPGTVLDVSPATKDSAASTFTPSPPGITTATDGDMIVAIIGVRSNNAACVFTDAETGFTQAAADTNQTFGGSYPLQVAYSFQTTHGPLTPSGASLSASSASYEALTLALKTFSGGGGGGVLDMGVDDVAVF